MKVIILTEGGKDIGFGHLTRCIALYQAIEKNGGNAELIINGDKSILDFIKSKKYQIFNWSEDEKGTKELAKKSEFIIIDSYLANKPLYDSISEIIDGRLLMIDDYNRIEYPKGIVINPSIYSDKLNYSQKRGVIYSLGQDYIILRKEFQNVPEKAINKKVSNILITFGGMDHSDLIYKITKYLKKQFNLNAFVMQSKSVIYDARRMINLIHNADICISGYGQTTYELARIGTPTLGICFARNQINNLKGWQEKGFIEYIGWHNDENLLDKLKKAFNRLIPYKERIRRSKIGRASVDGKGAERIIRHCFNK